MKFKPLHDKVLLKRVEQETKTASGIIIPESAQEKPMQAKVIAVGNGVISENGNIRPLDVKEGDTVLFTKWGGTEIKLDGEDYLILSEKDILGILS